LTPERIDTTAKVTLEQQGHGFAITAIHLDVSAKALGADNARFQEAAQRRIARSPRC